MGLNKRKVLKHIFFFLMLSIGISCNADKKDNREVNAEATVSLMDGYYPKNNIEFNQPIRIITTTTKEDFEKYFGVVKTMDNTVTKIDFDRFKVVAIVARPADRNQIIKISETKLKNNKLSINYHLELGEVQSYSSSDMKMFKIPKSVYAIDVYSKQDDPTPKR